MHLTMTTYVEQGSVVAQVLLEKHQAVHRQRVTKCVLQNIISCEADLVFLELILVILALVLNNVMLKDGVTTAIMAIIMIVVQTEL